MAASAQGGVQGGGVRNLFLDDLAGEVGEGELPGGVVSVAQDGGRPAA